ncbi:hypothetical protein [Ferruginibacter sp. HRS2-29]|uniref:hypothetical protein n=1 Tax=Ferruginibacter sp. HRS2-29 TaxID=2487334 RepID=UPI0020CBB269|nr:hypothetical protein [Ferruginibacter sp. HRS2-29]MCP9753407.1 hypothetical protein [Ferruginibacter sp. HRS2-29]
MSTPDYKSLLSVLLDATKANKLSWQRELTNSYLYFSLTPDNSKMLLDKYFAQEEDKEIPCLNFSIFTGEGKLVDEIVRCDSSDETEEYNILRDLYFTVDEIVSTEENKKSAPIINGITESLHKMIAG